MQIKKVNRLIFDSTEKQTLRNASILISQISRSMEENEIDDDFPVSLDDLVYGIDELINREYIGY
nr:MAG TPA: cullin family protein [Caudoviricetes sp.]